MYEICQGTREQEFCGTHPRPHKANKLFNQIRILYISKLIHTHFLLLLLLTNTHILNYYWWIALIIKLIKLFT